MHARVVVLPEVYDPDDYVKKIWSGVPGKYYSSFLMMVDYYMKKMVGSRDTLEDNLDASRESISFISAIKDPVERNLFTKRVSEKLGIDQKLLKDKIRKASTNYKTTPKTASQEKNRKRLTWWN